MKTFHIGGIHPASNKITSENAISAIPEPTTLTLLLQQSIGKPAKALVKTGDIVNAGQMIASADGMISANVHTPRAGKVSKIAKVRNQQGYWQEAVIIEVDASAPLAEFTEKSEKEVSAMAASDIIDTVRGAGIVGMGGAAFPTAVKLTPPESMKIDLLIINGAECEPYLTCDDRLMRERPEGILKGARLLMRAIGVKKCIVGIESNKPEALASMRKVAAGFEGISVEELVTKYPQGGEKQLITALTGREVPSGQLPASVGVIVDNVATAYAVYEAIYFGKPLIERVITVTGSVVNPGNFLVPVGTDIEYLLASAGGITGEGHTEVIAGGPMMGRDISRTEAPVVKATSGVLVLDDTGKKNEQACIRCGRCVHGCPMGLEPYMLIAQGRRRMWQEMKDNNVMDCVECGSCSWSCPSHKPLLDFIKLGKIEIRKQKL